MNKKVIITIVAIVAVFAALIGISRLQATERPTSYSSYKLATITDLASEINLDATDVYNVIPANSDSGNLPENIKGDPDAPVKIYEYADYQCEHCAALNPILNKIVEDYNGQVAVVFRAYVMSYHQHGVRSAAAANAAAIQGYWPAYKDLLYTNQNDWFYASESDAQQMFEDYFMKASDNKGDLDKFRSDMASAEVAQKIAHDISVGNKIDLPWTPLVYVNDKWVSQQKPDSEKNYTNAEFDQVVRNEIDAQLKK